MINLNSKKLAIFFLVLLILPQLLCAEEEPSKQQQKCLQCGTWQISGSGADGLEGQILLINQEQIIIPGCGVFDYRVTESRALQGKNKLLLSLKQIKESFLCAKKKDDTWTLDMEISGHMKDNSKAEFNLHRGRSTQPTLWLYCWNMDREDPCEAGSGIGSSVCTSIERSLIYKALSDQAASVYGMLINMKVTKPPSFNAARFYAAALEFCIKSEKDSGVDAWPMAYAYGCQSDILKQKFEEFVSWHSCIDKNKNKFSACNLPSEDFDRSRKK